MAASMNPERRRDLLDSIARPQPAKANPDLNGVERAAQILRAAIQRSGEQQKVLGHSPAQISRQLAGTERLWFHDMVATWPAEVWCELLVELAQTVCAGRFSVERSVTLRRTA